MHTEKRRHRRLDISLPVAFATVDQGAPTSGSTTTLNVSTGGVYFGTRQPGLAPGRRLNVELSIPPGQGHFPYEGRISSEAEVVRVDPLEGNTGQWGVAAQFRNPPRLDF